MRNKAVIGLGFGDEGKGQFTDYLCSQSPDAMVVRFSGGHQAGHTVEHGKIRHVFANFGSGTLRGNHSYWSEHCTLEPTGLLNELALLRSYGIEPCMYVAGDCPVTTPWDIIRNRTLERLHRNGSCGVGFGETIQREEDYRHLHYKDLFYPKVLVEKVRLIQDYYNSDSDPSEFLRKCDEITEQQNFILAFGVGLGSCIYEGSQGLLLDQHYGFFPNVTRSNTGTKNLPSEDLDIYYITRCYQTRHGNGFMSNEDDGLIHKDPLETNRSHEFQGEFRRGLLDLEMLNYALESDMRTIMGRDNKYLVITCLDHMMVYACIRKGVKYTFNTIDEFVTFLRGNLSVDFDGVYTSSRQLKGIQINT